MARDTRLVYSTDHGRIRETAAATLSAATANGPVLIRRETKGRKGKGVTTVSGLPLKAAELKALASRLKQLCGTGGAVKENVIEIDRKSTRLNSSHVAISYAVFCLKKKRH